MLKVQFFMMFCFANKTNSFFSTAYWCDFSLRASFSYIFLLASLASVLFRLQYTYHSVYCSWNRVRGSLKGIILIACFEMRISVEISALGRRLAS